MSFADDLLKQRGVPYQQTVGKDEEIPLQTMSFADQMLSQRQPQNLSLDGGINLSTNAQFSEPNVNKMPQQNPNYVETPQSSWNFNSRGLSNPQQAQQTGFNARALENPQQAQQTGLNSRVLEYPQQAQETAFNSREIVDPNAIPDIRDPRQSLSPYLPEGSSPYGTDIIKASFMDMFNNSPEGRVENFKNLFKDNFKGAKKGPQGDILIDLSDKEGNIKTFSLDAPNDELFDFVADTPDMIWEGIKFYYGSKGLGKLIPGLNTIASGKGATILKEGLKSGIIEGVGQGLANQDAGVGFADAGIETAGSILTDGLLTAITKTPYLASKAPLVGDAVGKFRKKFGEVLYGAFGGDKTMASAIGGLPRSKATKDILRRTVDTVEQGKVTNNLARELVRDMPIDDATKKDMILNMTKEDAELLIGVEIKDTLTKVASDTRDYFVNVLHTDSDGMLDPIVEKITKMSPVEFMKSAEAKEAISDMGVNSKEFTDIFNMVEDYINNPSPLKIKPSEIGLGEFSKNGFRNGGIGMVDDVEPYLRTKVLQKNPTTIDEWTKIYNEETATLAKKIQADDMVSDKEKAELLNELKPFNLEKFFKSNDAKTATIKSMINNTSIASGVVTAVGIGSLTTGGLAGLGMAGGVKLLGSMLNKNPQSVIDGLQTLSKIAQRTKIDPKSKNLMSALTPEQVISAKRYLATGEFGDAVKFVMQMGRRQSEMQERLRQKVDGADLSANTQQTPKQEPKQQPIRYDLNNLGDPVKQTDDFWEKEMEPLPSSGAIYPEEFNVEPKISSLIKKIDKLDRQLEIMSKKGETDSKVYEKTMWDWEDGKKELNKLYEEWAIERFPPAVDENSPFNDNSVPMPYIQQYENRKPKKEFF